MPWTVSLYLEEEGSRQANIGKEVQNQRGFTDVLLEQSKGKLELEYLGCTHGQWH